MLNVETSTGDTRYVEARLIRDSTGKWQCKNVRAYEGILKLPNLSFFNQAASISENCAALIDRIRRDSS